jgi:hypothetical protein
MQQEAIEDYQQRLNRYETPGGGSAVRPCFAVAQEPLLGVHFFVRV